jgi:hypothetical protein
MIAAEYTKINQISTSPRGPLTCPLGRGRARRRIYPVGTKLRRISIGMSYNNLLNADEIRSLIFSELTSLGFQLNENGDILISFASKEDAKRLHRPAREKFLSRNIEWIRRNFRKYENYFANGEEIIPGQIAPVLVQVQESWQSDLFRLARFYWSIPYSHGFGRRLRFLILDSSNGKLIGIFGLQSPPITFPVRDRLFEYPSGQKELLVNQTMDIFTLGALPPYNRLLGGKLVAMAACSDEVREAYRLAYKGRVTEMEKRVLPAHLVALTTTSAFGRSSIYNRLKYKGQLLAESLGFTNGYGNFHLQRLYPLFKEYLDSIGIDTKGGYGTGPKRSWQLIRLALNHLNVSADLLKHGIQREAFLFRLIENLDEYMCGKNKKPIYKHLPFVDLAAHWKERYLLPRSERVDGWHRWDKQEILKDITTLTETEYARIK